MVKKFRSRRDVKRSQEEEDVASTTQDETRYAVSSELVF
jgi:hypothetical protein